MQKGVIIAETSFTFHRIPMPRSMKQYVHCCGDVAGMLRGDYFSAAVGPRKTNTSLRLFIVFFAHKYITRMIIAETPIIFPIVAGHN